MPTEPQINFPFSMDLQHSYGKLLNFFDFSFWKLTVVQKIFVIEFGLVLTSKVS